ncbi:MAG TPA: Gfo/Idh/MocA family oxidoreductase [Longimicrobiaceae bacterium]|nr:Gfo/Idh/MocA family oxidoreductase [Longimicrobiaceae bacterium]
MTERLRVGVVGVGSLGFHHARILRDVPGAALVGVHDIDPERSSRVSEELGVRAFPSLEELLGRVEAVVVAVPTSDHAAVALAAIDRGVHLLIEKPIASSLEEADRIVRSADARGVLVATGHVERFNGALRACEPFLEGPRFIESHRLAPFNPRGTDVAVVLDLMIHDIDLVLSLIESPVSSVRAVGVPILTPSVDIANARLEFEDGAVANITASRVSMERTRKIRFFQPSGYVSLDLARGTGEFLRLRRDAPLLLMEEGLANLSLDRVVERVELKGDGAEPLRSELEAFVRAVRGEGKIVVSGHDGRQALAVALEIMQRIEHHVAGWRAA